MELPQGSSAVERPNDTSIRNGSGLEFRSGHSFSSVMLILNFTLKIC